jgi:formate/nitrite transporter FocA (FNT family)
MQDPKETPQDEQENVQPVEIVSNKPKSLERIVGEQIEEGLEIYEHEKTPLLISATTAGMEIGFSFFLIAVIYSTFEKLWAPEYVKMAAAFAYPIGFILVVLGRSVLFTEQTTLSVLPILNGKKRLDHLVVVWGIVILGNLIGGYAIAGLITTICPPLEIITEKSIATIAEHVAHGSWVNIVGSAVLAGWLMALLSWLVTSSTETISRIFIIFIITTVIGMGGLHHSIVGSIEVFSGLIVPSDLTIMDYLRFQSASLLGNAVGGVVFVALLKYRIFQGNSEEESAA